MSLVHLVRWPAAAVCACFIISGCSPSEDDADGGGARSTIRSFSLTGTDGAAGVSPSQNGGVFTIRWDAQSSTEPYRADVYVSLDGVFSSDDKAILGRNCDQPAGDCQLEAATFSCSFNSSNIITCPTGAGGTSTNMTDYFAGRGLPGSYQLVLKVCDGLFQDCVTSAIPVTFQ